MRTSTYHFNKEIIFAEIGAIIGAPLLPFLITIFSGDVTLLSLFTAIGAFIGATVIWFSLRTYHQHRLKLLSLKKFTSDLLYFTPAASILSLITYYPVLYLLTRVLLERGNHILFSAIVAEIISFALFLGAVNLYRGYLFHRHKVEL